MKAKIYEKYYKLGFDHMMYKDIMGLKKPKTRTKTFYLILIVVLIAIGLLVF